MDDATVANYIAALGATWTTWGTALALLLFGLVVLATTPILARIRK